MGCWCIDIDVIIRERFFLINLIFENNGVGWMGLMRGWGQGRKWEVGGASDGGEELGGWMGGGGELWVRMF